MRAPPQRLVAIMIMLDHDFIVLTKGIFEGERPTERSGSFAEWRTAFSEELSGRLMALKVSFASCNDEEQDLLVEGEDRMGL